MCVCLSVPYVCLSQMCVCPICVSVPHVCLSHYLLHMCVCPNAFYTSHPRRARKRPPKAAYLRVITECTIFKKWDLFLQKSFEKGECSAEKRPFHATILPFGKSQCMVLSYCQKRGKNTVLLGYVLPILSGSHAGRVLTIVICCIVFYVSTLQNNFKV